MNETRRGEEGRREERMKGKGEDMDGEYKGRWGE